MTFSPAHNDNPLPPGWRQSDRLLDWLSRFNRSGLSFGALNQPFDTSVKAPVAPPQAGDQTDDWQTVANLCGYGAEDFASAGTGLPLSAAEIDYFRRNHRGTENHISRDFLTARSSLPSPLAELYGLYLHRCRVDAEAALFLVQATGSTRVARVMADLLAVGSFANGLELISHIGVTYSVPTAFDTSEVIDQANHEAMRRLALEPDHPSHLLKLTPDEIGVLAANIVEKHALVATAFLEKARLLSESRQDVNRLPTNQHFVTALIERDLPVSESWVARICAAYARLLEGWVVDLPEMGEILH